MASINFGIAWKAFRVIVNMKKTLKLKDSTSESKLENIPHEIWRSNRLVRIDIQ